MGIRKQAWLAVLVAVGFAGTVAAETIKDVKIVDPNGELFDISSVSAFTSFSAGDEVRDREQILSTIGVDVDRMRKSGRFSYVSARMDIDQSDEGIIVVYTVKLKHHLRRLEIVGADKMRNRKIRKKLELEMGQFVDDAELAQAAARLKAAYRDFWYPYAQVQWDSKTDDALGTADVIFTIVEGAKFVVKKIEFEGNENIDKDRLTRVMQQKQKSWIPLWSTLTGRGKYLPEMVDADIFAIKSLYMDEGFLDVRVEEPDLIDTRPKRSKMVIQIEEGRQYKVRSVDLEGIEEFTEEAVMRGIRLHPGDDAAYDAIEAGSESIRTYYGNRGYVRTRVRPVLDADASAGLVDIRYEVDEGPIGTINKVVIRGNDKTKDKVIRREMVIYPGDKYHRGYVKRSENRLRNLNFFDMVNSSTDPVGDQDKYDLTMKVHEKSTGQFTAGVGFSSIDSLVGYTELSQGNFDITRWPPSGAGQKFKIRAQLGTKRNDLDISFVEPWLFDRQLSFGIDLYHREARYFSDSYDQKTDGARFSFGKPLTPFSRVNLAYSIERFDVFDVSPSASQAIQEEEGVRNKSGIDLTFTRDTRNHFMWPSKGAKTQVTPYFAGGALGGQTDLFGGRIRSTHYWPFFADTVLNIRGAVETVDFYGESDRVPIFDRLFLGGAYTLRGYDYRDVAPYDPTLSDAEGGQSSAFTSVEYTVPVWQKVRAATFYDIGFVNRDPFDFDVENYHSDWGVGLRLDMPGFPLQIDYAWPIRYKDPLTDKGRFNFNIGQSF